MCYDQVARRIPTAVGKPPVGTKWEDADHHCCIILGGFGVPTTSCSPLSSAILSRPKASHDQWTNAGVR